MSDQALQVVTATPVAVAAGGQLVFGYTLSDLSAIICITIAIVQFTYWLYSTFLRGKDHGKD